MNKLLLKNFKVVVAEKEVISEVEKERRKEYLLTKGLLFSDVDIKDFEDITKEAISLYGNEIERLNATFYQNMKESDLLTSEEKEILQVMHYASTYGKFEELKNDGNVFSLNTNKELEEKISDFVTYIEVIEEKDVKALVLKELTKDIALKENTVKELIEIIEYFKIDLTKEYNEIKNRQFKIYLTEKYGIVPKNVDEFFRLIFHTVMGEKNTYKTKRYLYFLDIYLKDKEKKEKVSQYIQSYVSQYGIRDLGLESNRYRKIWLVIKKNTKLTIINRILRVAKKEVKPKTLSFVESALNLDLETFRKGIHKVSNSNLVKLYNVMLYRQNQDGIMKEEIVIRNGNSKFLRRNYDKQSYQEKIDLVKEQLKNNLKEKYENKTVLLPKELELAVPYNEKQLLGSYIPFGSKVITDVHSDLSIGINWNYASDIDIHSLNNQGHGIGYYNSQDGFSGDMTGTNKQGFASEFIRVRNAINLGDFTQYFASLYYSRDNQNNQVQLVVGKTPKLSKGPMIKKEDLVIALPFYFDEDFSSMVSLGFVEEDDYKYVFTLGGRGDFDVTKDSSMGFWKEKISNVLMLADLLTEVGANIVKEKTEEVDYDFSLEKLTRETVLSILEV